jgi:hypothetical protein
MGNASDFFMLADAVFQGRNQVAPLTLKVDACSGTAARSGTSPIVTSPASIDAQTTGLEIAISMRS